MVSAATVQTLRDAVAHVGQEGSAKRGLLAIPAVWQLASSGPVAQWARAVLGEHARPVRGILFDKTADANWLVAWHQDLVFPVASRIETPGFGPWSVKDGVPHTGLPRVVLEDMLSVRLHLDDCGTASGALEVAPGSHRRGKLGRDEIEALLAERSADTCPARAGDVLLMRPLTLHRSSKASAPSRRRVVHLEYAGSGLPGPLRWPQWSAS
ncbi:Phytanoyl-CoA dioxygenase (PhyH) [Pirellulimonas nuda]|uniref:Phytanoyl-CoA dioxygenase (PhyH) n=1 Tax=Pirellulimonas nuda TaxID=2528009 RepID=A0A518DH91_9BACT|nr:Phytanoyl-CoA dioxygenase (PhyH) [Pirellulimonas nuda]